jgi:hypothetical protein
MKTKSEINPNKQIFCYPTGFGLIIYIDIAIDITIELAITISSPPPSEVAGGRKTRKAYLFR